MGKYSFKFDVLAQRIKEIVKIGNNNKMSFSDMFLFNELISILESAYPFDSEIHEQQRYFIITEGINNFAHVDIKDGRQLLNQIKKSEKEYLNKEINKYTILSSFSFPYFYDLFNMRIFRSHIKFYEYSYPAKFNYRKLINNLKYYSDYFPPHGYVPLTINVSGRNVLEAMDIGIETLDLVRGIWNYSINNKVPYRIHIGPVAPINIIRLGPTQTIHCLDGKLATDDIWHEQNYINKSSTWDVKNKWKYIVKEFRWIRAVLNKMPYKNQFIKVFIRYTRALDTADYEASYLKLWSLLEILTDTINSNYDKTISRALFFYKDDILYKEIIEHLRLSRNRIIHYDETRDNLDPLVFQIKRIVEKIIYFHLKFAGDFYSMEEFGRFLDLPKNKTDLDNEILIRKKAVKYFDKY